MNETANPEPSVSQNPVVDDTKAHSVTDRLVEAAGIQIDRLPMLPVIFDRIASNSAEQLRSICPSPCYFSYSHVEQGKAGEILENYEANAVAAIIAVPEWDCHVVLGFERDLIFTMAEAIFGGDGSEPPEENGRTFSNIEMKICQRLGEMMCRVLHQAFGVATKAEFVLERLETRMHFAVMGRRNAQVSCATFLVQAINRGGEIFLILPHSGLGPVRRSLETTTQGDPDRKDTAWSRKMQAGVTRASIELRAVLDEETMTLDEVSRMRPGDVIALSATPKTPVKLEGNGQPLFWCQLGQAEGVYKLRIDTVFDPEQEFIGDLINH